MAQTQLVFISGGVRSGKSQFAELYVEQFALAKKSSAYYLATAKSFDSEMTKRIEQHKQQRQNKSISWETLEYATEIEQAIEVIHSDRIVLLDCLTVLLSNEFYAHGISDNVSLTDPRLEEVKQNVYQGVMKLAGHAQLLVLVSNEIFHEARSKSTYVEAYRKVLGELHQLFVKKAVQAFSVEASVPTLEK